MTTPPTEEPYISAEEAERRTNREAMLIIGAGGLFLCVPTMLCFPQYFQFVLMIGMMTMMLLAALGTLISYVISADLLTRIGLRKRKRFIPADEETSITNPPE